RGWFRSALASVGSLVSRKKTASALYPIGLCAKSIKRRTFSSGCEDFFRTLGGEFTTSAAAAKGSGSRPSPRSALCSRSRSRDDGGDAPEESPAPCGRAG